MHDNIDLNPAMIHLVEKMQADRAALQHILDADPHAFAEQNRLLAAFQSAVRSVDILDHSAKVSAAPEPAGPLSPVLRAATAALADEQTYSQDQRLPRVNAADPGVAALGMAAVAEAIQS